MPSTNAALDASLNTPLSQNTTQIMSCLHSVPAEIRNQIYEFCFPLLPSMTMPLIHAHHYRPSTGLCLADKRSRSETVANINPISAAWRNTTFTVDTDHFFPPALFLAEGDRCGAMWPEDLTENLTDADARHIKVIEFSTRAVVLPEVEDGEDEFGDAVEGPRVLSQAFKFTISRPSTNKLMIDTPLLDEFWKANPDVEVDCRVPELLFRLHVLLCKKQWESKRGGRAKGGRSAWTASEIGELLERLEDTVSELKGLNDGTTTEWADARQMLEDFGVWDGRLPGERKMMLRDTSWYAQEIQEEADASGTGKERS